MQSFAIELPSRLESFALLYTRALNVNKCRFNKLQFALLIAQHTHTHTPLVFIYLKITVKIRTHMMISQVSL